MMPGLIRSINEEPSNWELSRMVEPLVTRKLEELRLESKKLQPMTENLIRRFVAVVYKIQAFLNVKGQVPSNLEVKLMRSSGLVESWEPVFVIESNPPFNSLHSAQSFAELPWTKYVEPANPWPKYWRIMCKYEEATRTERQEYKESDFHKKDMPPFEDGESYLPMVDDMPVHGTAIDLGWFLYE